MTVLINCSFKDGFKEKVETSLILKGQERKKQENIPDSRANVG
jgi:hypothetical protein